MAPVIIKEDLTPGHLSNLRTSMGMATSAYETALVVDDTKKMDNIINSFNLDDNRMDVWQQPMSGGLPGNPKDKTAWLFYVRDVSEEKEENMFSVFKGPCKWQLTRFNVLDIGRRLRAQYIGAREEYRGKTHTVENDVIFSQHESNDFWVMLAYNRQDQKLVSAMYYPVKCGETNSRQFYNGRVMRPLYVKQEQCLAAYELKNSQRARIVPIKKTPPPTSEKKEELFEVQWEHEATDDGGGNCKIYNRSREPYEKLKCRTVDEIWKLFTRTSGSDVQMGEIVRSDVNLENVEFKGEKYGMVGGPTMKSKYSGKGVASIEIYNVGLFPNAKKNPEKREMVDKVNNTINAEGTQKLHRQIYVVQYRADNVQYTWTAMITPTIADNSQSLTYNTTGPVNAVTETLDICNDNPLYLKSDPESLKIELKRRMLAHMRQNRYMTNRINKNDADFSELNGCNVRAIIFEKNVKEPIFVLVRWGGKSRSKSKSGPAPGGIVCDGAVGGGEPQGSPPHDPQGGGPQGDGPQGDGEPHGSPPHDPQDDSDPPGGEPGGPPGA